MKYMLMIYLEEHAWDNLTESERQKIYGEFRDLRQQLTSSGHYLGGSELQPVRTARTVRVRDNKPLVTDGPFAETHEHLGGYFLIEARDIDEAAAIAARVPTARMGSIEVRALIETAAPTTA